MFDYEKECKDFGNLLPCDFKVNGCEKCPLMYFCVQKTQDKLKVTENGRRTN